MLKMIDLLDHIAQLKAQVGPTSGYQPMQPLQADGGLYRNQPNDYFNNNRYGVPPAEKLHGEASRTSFTEKLQPPPGAMASRGLPILYPPTPDHELIRRGVQTGYLATCVESSWKEVSFQWKNPDFLSRNPDFLLKNLDLIIYHRAPW